MAKRVGMEVSVAIGEVVKLANADVIAAYPITPQTHIVEHLAELVANGELDAEFIPVESEHSVMSACLGASAVGDDKVFQAGGYARYPVGIFREGVGHLIQRPLLEGLVISNDTATGAE